MILVGRIGMKPNKRLERGEHSGVAKISPAMRPRLLPGPRPILVAVLLLTGCAASTTSAPLTTNQRALAAAAQRLADRIAEVYRVSAVNVLLGPLAPGQGALIHRNGVMTLSPETLDFSEMIRDAYIAHEMGHWILGHVAGPAVAVSEQQQREIDADVKAVEILTRSKSMPEARAFAAVYAQQMASKQTLDEGKTVPLASHPDPCRKMAALLAAYPAQQVFVDRLKQNPKAWLCRP